MEQFKFETGFVTNLVLVSNNPQMVVVIVMNQHLAEGSRLYTAIEDTPIGIEIYTEKLEDLAERYDIPKEKLLREMNKLKPKKESDENNSESDV